MSNRTEVATLGGGCFWCLEAVYLEMRGVLKVESGYSNGNVPNPTYRQVCNGDTGYVEVVQITFDPDEVSYRELLQVFFVIHDPTTLNRQGADAGTQYRSGIYYTSPEQKADAEAVVLALTAQKVYDDPIVTEIEPLRDYYRAEDYHQDYFARNPYQPYCMGVVAPKVAKFRKYFLEKTKKNA